MNAQRLYRLTILLTVIALYSGHVQADAWQQSVSLRMSAEYDTNPAMTPANTEGVWRALFEPGYILTGILDENEVKTGLALQTARSSNATLSPDRNSPTVFLDWLHHIEEGEVGIASRYAEIATREAGADASGLISVASTRASRTLSGRLSKTLNEQSTLAADGSYESVSYTGGTFIDYATRSANMIFSYAWGERSTYFLKTHYADFIPTDGGSTSRLASAILGLTWNFSDTLEGTLQAGKSKTSGVAKLGTVGGAAMRYSGDLTQLTIDAERQVSPSGLGGFVTVDKMNVNSTYAISERSNSGIDLVWQKSLFDAIILYRTAGAWIQYDLDSFWSIRTYYRHIALAGDRLENTSSNILGCTFIYSHTDF